MISRRTCVKGMWGAVAALHCELLRPVSKLVFASDIMPLDNRPSLELQQKIYLRRIQLQCIDLDGIELFYRKTIGLTTTRVGDGDVEVVIGDSRLTFCKAKTAKEPFYHFAFNISKNKFLKAKRWLADRTELVVAPDGRDQFHFTSRDADAVYFLDPAGNLVEFIAHSRLNNERPGEFSTTDMLDVCEIGLVIGDMAKSLEKIKSEFGAAPYLPPFSDDFAAVGDERGFLILVKKERLWFPRRKRPAMAFETIVQMTGNQRKTVVLAEAATTFEILEEESAPD